MALRWVYVCGPGGCLANGIYVCVESTVKFSGASVMVYDCFSWFKLGPLVLVNGNMNSEVYVNILDNSMLSTQWQQFGICPFLYQHDNDFVHNAEVNAS